MPSELFSGLLSVSRQVTSEGVVIARVIAMQCGIRLPRSHKMLVVKGYKFIFCKVGNNTIG